MSTLKLHGSLLSVPLLRVLATLYEKELDYEFVPVDIHAGDQKKHFSKISWGQLVSIGLGIADEFGVPTTFEDGDLKLFESRAITQYIAHTYASSGTQLIPADHKKMAIVGVWMEVEAHQFEPIASKLAWELVFKPMLGMVTDEAVVEEQEAKLCMVLDVYEARLGDSKYLGGDCFTLADLHHQPGMHFLIGTRVKKLFDCRKRVSAWCQDILDRPAWAKVIDIQKPAQ